MSVFTRLRKSFRLDSPPLDCPPSPGSFHSGSLSQSGWTDLTAEKDPASWLQAQYVPLPLGGDKHHRRLGNSLLTENDADDYDQTANVIYINTTETPARPPHSSANTNIVPRSASTPPSTASPDGRRPNSLMSTTTTSRHPYTTTSSYSSPSKASSVQPSRKRSASVQGHDTQRIHPYARALESEEFGERSDSINVGPVLYPCTMKFPHSCGSNLKWVQSLKSTPNSASSTSSRAPKSTPPSSATSSSSSSKAVMGNSHSRKANHSRQISAPTSSGSSTPSTPSSSGMTTSSRRAPPPPIRVPSSQRVQPTAERPPAPRHLATENRELERVVEEADQEDERRRSAAQNHAAPMPTAKNAGRGDPPTTTKEPPPPAEEMNQPPKLVRPPNPLLPQDNQTDCNDLEDPEQGSLSLVAMRELLISSGWLDFDPYPSEPPKLTLPHKSDGENSDADADAHSMRSEWREFCRASGIPAAASLVEGGIGGGKERMKSRASSVRQDSATLPGDVLQRCQEEFMEKMERLSMKSGKSTNARRSKSKSRITKRKSDLNTLASGTPTIPPTTATSGISWLSSDPSPSEFPIPPTLWQFLQGEGEIETVPELEVTSASPEKERKESPPAISPKPYSPSLSRNSTATATSQGRKHIRRSMSEGSLRAIRSRHGDHLSADGHGSTVILSQPQERDRPAFSPTQVPMSAALSHHSLDDAGVSPLPPLRSPLDNRHAVPYNHRNQGADKPGKKRVTSMAIDDLPFGERYAPQEEPLEEEASVSPYDRDKELSSASSLATPPLLMKGSSTSLSASSSPSTALWTLSGNNSGSSINLINRSAATLATSVRTDAAPIQVQPLPPQTTQYQSQRGSRNMGSEQPGTPIIGPKIPGSRSPSISLLSIGGTERRPSAPNIGEQPKVLDQRRPSLPLGKRLATDSGTPRLPIGSTRRDSFYGARPQPHRRTPPEASVPQTVRTSSPTLSFESIGPSPPNVPRLGSSPNGSSVISYLTNPQSSHLMGRDRSNSHSSIRSRGSATVSASGPDFDPIPIRWRGLTMDAAKWMMTSDELQDLVREAIQHSAKTVSIRLLPSQVLNYEVPEEIKRLEQQVEQIQRKYRVQVRRRRVLCKSLSLYLDGSDPVTARRLIDDLADANATSDALAEDLYQATEQLAQLRHLRDNHYTSALAMALRKINGSLLKKAEQVDELREKVATLEAEREYAWDVAKTVEEEIQSVHELLHPRNRSSFTTLERSNSRVEAARKGASRISQANLHLTSSRRSLRSSFGSGRFPSRPSSSIPGDDVPPVPPVPLTAVTLQSIQSENRSQAGDSRTSSVPETLDEAQAALMELLGIASHDLQPSRRRSASFCSPRRSGYSSSSKDDHHSSPLRVRSSSGSLISNLARRHSLSALNPCDDPLIKPQLST